jgi:hypothetical protein
MPIVVDVDELEHIRREVIPVEPDLTEILSPQASVFRSSPRNTTLETKLGKPSKLSVPCIIHQIYPTTTSASSIELYNASKSAWIQHHPSFIYVQWDDAMIRVLIRQYYPSLIKKYLKYRSKRKLLLAISCILHRYGGIYSDFRLNPNCNIWHLFNGRENLYVSYHNSTYSDLILASPPESPIWHDLMVGGATLARTIDEYDGTIGLLPSKFLFSGYFHLTVKSAEYNTGLFLDVLIIVLLLILLIIVLFWYYRYYTINISPIYNRP